MDHQLFHLRRAAPMWLNPDRYPAAGSTNKSGWSWLNAIMIINKREVKIITRLSPFFLFIAAAEAQLLHPACLRGWKQIVAKESDEHQIAQ